MLFSAVIFQVTSERENGADGIDDDRNRDYDGVDGDELCQKGSSQHLLENDQNI